MTPAVGCKGARRRPRHYCCFCPTKKDKQQQQRDDERQQQEKKRKMEAAAAATTKTAAPARSFWTASCTHCGPGAGFSGQTAAISQFYLAQVPLLKIGAPGVTIMLFSATIRRCNVHFCVGRHVSKLHTL